MVKKEIQQSKERKLRIFISMPFTGKLFEELTNERERLNRLVQSYDFELLEQFISYQKKADFESKDYDPSYILAKDKHMIKQADVVICDFTSPSIGTDCELTIAKELFDKKVYAVVPKEKRKHSWLKFYCDYFVDSIEDALEKIKTDFAGKISGLNIEKRQYDPIAIEYRLVENTPAQKYIYDPTVANFIRKNGQGKTIVVLHAGSGHRARLAKKNGASTVIGIDLSHKQIQIAREEEMSDPLGINYFVLDPYSRDFIASLPRDVAGKVDIVLGFFLLDHAMNKEELRIVTDNIHKLLKPKGLLFGMIDQTYTSSDLRYGVVLSLEGTKKSHDGSLRRVSIYQNGLEVLHFHNFIWKKETIEFTLKSSRFTQVTLSNASVSLEGVQELGKEFWNAYEKSPEQLIFSGKK